jgi:pilus assembly protein CpaD
MTSRISQFGLGLLLFASLSACMTKNNGFRDNAGLDSMFKATVTLQETTHQLSFANGKLSAIEEVNLAAFLSASGLRYADRLTLRISEPAMSNGYRSSINIVLGRFGLSISNVETIIGLQTGKAILAVSRPTVTLPECGIHSGPNGLNSNNENMSNYGCATRSNLAAMVANPADLVSGNELDGQGADITAKPVDGFANHELTGIKVEGDKKVWTPQGPKPKIVDIGLIGVTLYECSLVLLAARCKFVQTRAFHGFFVR